MLAAGEGPAGKKKNGIAAAAAIRGVGLARAAGVAGLDVEEAAEDERYLRQVRHNTSAFGHRHPRVPYQLAIEQVWKGHASGRKRNPLWGTVPFRFVPVADSARDRLPLLHAYMQLSRSTSDNKK